MSTVPLGDLLQDWNVANREQNKKLGRDPNTLGVYSAYPTATPKYLRQQRNRDAEYEGTMARFLLEVPVGTYDDFINELEGDTRKIAKVLASENGFVDGRGYIDFILSQANHSLNEKVQISETLSDNYAAFFFGQSPPIFQYSGYLYNTFQDDWTMRMYLLFQKLARGTQLARRGFMLHLRYDSLIVSGSMVNLQWALTGAQEAAADFSFGMLVKKITVLYGGVSSVTSREPEVNRLFESTGLTENDPLGNESPIDALLTAPSASGPAGISNATRQDTLSQLAELGQTGLS